MFISSLLRHAPYISLPRRLVSQILERPILPCDLDVDRPEPFNNPTIDEDDMPIALKKPRSEETAMQIAMQSAGVQNPAEEGERNAKALANEAWDRHPGSFQERRKFLISRLMSQSAYWIVQKSDPSAMNNGIAWLLDLVGKERQPKSSSVTSLAVATAPGPVITQTPDRGRRPGAEPFRGKFGLNPRLDEAIAEQNRSAAARAVSKLDTFLINGVPLRFITVSDARKWAKMIDDDIRMWKTDATFIRNLCANLSGDMVIGEVWKDVQEIDRLYESSAAITISSDVG